MGKHIIRLECMLEATRWERRKRVVGFAKMRDHSHCYVKNALKWVNTRSSNS